MSRSGEGRPIPRGYYAMTVKELRDFVTVGAWPGEGNAPLMVEIDGDRFPVIKIVRGPGSDGAVVLRVPPAQIPKT
jgi:hypothetical protein